MKSRKDRFDGEKELGKRLHQSLGPHPLGRVRPPRQPE